MAGPGEVPYQKFLDEADTGDVVLFTGTAAVSAAVELATFSVYSHSALVIKDPATGQKYLFQSNFEPAAPDPLAGGKAHSGVQAGPLAAVVQGLYVEGDYPSWRRLSTWPARDDTTFWRAAQAIDGTEFPVVWKSPGVLDGRATLALMALILFTGRQLKQRSTERLFCSGAVASVLQAAGILDSTEYPPNAYEPKDFSSMYPGFARWTPGVEWYDDLRVVMPPGTGNAAPT